MKVGVKAIWLGVVLGLVVAYFYVVATFRQQVGLGMLFVIVIGLFVGLLISLPAGEAISQKLMDKLFGAHAGKVSRDYSKAKGLLAEGRFEEAIAEFRRALEEKPENVTLRLEIAEIYARELRDYPKAIGEYEAALGSRITDSQRASILNRMADIYESALRNVEAALKTLSRIVETLPGTDFAARATERIAAIRARRPVSGEGFKEGA